MNQLHRYAGTSTVSHVYMQQVIIEVYICTDDYVVGMCKGQKLLARSRNKDKSVLASTRNRLCTRFELSTPINSYHSVDVMHISR